MPEETATDRLLKEALPVASEVEQFAAVAARLWPAHLIAAVVFVWLSWGALPTTYLASWMGGYAIFLSARTMLFRRYHALTHAQRVADETRWRCRFTAMMGIYGTLQSLLIAAALPWLPLGSSVVMTWLIFFSIVLVTTVMPLSELSMRLYIGVTLMPTAVAWLFVRMEYSWVISLGLAAVSIVFLKGGRARLAALGQTSRLAEQLAESNALLKRSNMSRTRMIMEASHDLRQPAHALGMMVERLRCAPPGPDFQLRVREIESGIFSLSDMLTELMEFSRLDLGEYVPHVEPVNLAALLQEVDQRFDVVAQGKGLAWAVHMPPIWVDSDPWLLRRIINNLVSNALKYTSHGTISVGCVARGNEVTVFVQDTGPGIERRHQERVFIEYVRLHNAETDEPGMGVGLAFAKRAADALRHRLRLESKVGAGTRMTVTMPMHASQDGLSSSGLDTGSALQDMLFGNRVLLLENDPMLLSSMSDVLAGWGMMVNALAGTDELGRALRVPGMGQPDIIVADMHLDGELDGLQAVARIRRQFRDQPIPAILLTGDLSPGVEERASAQQTRVAYKPMRPSRLKSLMGDEIARAVGAR